MQTVEGVSGCSVLWRFQSFVFTSLSFIFCLQTPAQELVSLLCFRLLAAAFKKNEKKCEEICNNQRRSRWKGTEGWSRSERRLCFNYTAEVGFEPALLRWLLWKDDYLIWKWYCVQPNWDRFPSWRDEAETEQWNNSEGAATFPRTWMANVIFLQLRGGWGGVCVCWIYMWRMMWVCNFKQIFFFLNLSPSNTLLCSFVWVCKHTVV